MPVYAAAPKVLEAVTGFHVHRGILGSVHRPPVRTAAELLATARRIVILEDVNTHTNVGAIFRCAAGMGMDAVLLSPSCADPLYRRSVRVSMGEVFAVPYARLDPWPAAIGEVRDAGFTVLALTPDPEAVSLRALSPADRARPALLLGAEGPGLSGKALTAPTCGSGSRCTAAWTRSTSPPRRPWPATNWALRSRYAGRPAVGERASAPRRVGS